MKMDQSPGLPGTATPTRCAIVVPRGDPLAPLYAMDPAGDPTMADGWAPVTSPRGRAQHHVAVLSWGEVGYDGVATCWAGSAAAAVRRLGQRLAQIWPDPAAVRAARAAEPGDWAPGSRREVRDTAGAVVVSLTAPILTAPCPSGLVEWQGDGFSGALRIDSPGWLETAVRALDQRPCGIAARLRGEHRRLGRPHQRSWSTHVGGAGARISIAPAYIDMVGE